MDRILIIDDDARIRRMLIRSLHTEYGIVEAESGEHAVALLAETETPFDLILLDQMMPQMDGLETLAAIRALDPYVPVIMLSAHGSLALGVEFMRAGGNDFIEKPIVDMDLVRVRLQRALKASAQARRAMAQRQQAETLLLENEEHYRTLIEYAPDGMLIGDAHGRLIDMNSSACTLLGTTREALFGISLRDLVTASDRNTAQQQLDRLRGGHTVLCTLQLQRPDGTMLVVEVRTKQLPDGRWQSIVRDISERQPATIPAAHELRTVHTLSNHHHDTLCPTVSDLRQSQEEAAIQSGARVLIAEDNGSYHRTIAHMLEQLNCHVDVVANGHEAIEALARRTYDCILMDYQMPEMDGLTATIAIRMREAQTGGHIPIIAMLANATQYDLENCLRAGMDDYMSKPVQVKDLVAVLQQWAPWAHVPHTSADELPT